MKKINNSNQGEVRQLVLDSLKESTDLVGMTLGPNGRSVLIERPGEPLMVDDGRRAMENIKFDDPIKQMAARVCYSVTRATDEKVSNGTTTSLVMAYGIFKENVVIGPGAIMNVAQIDRDIMKGRDEVLDLLDKEAKQIKTEKELVDVAKIAAGDEEIGKMLGEMQWKLGKKGHISIEFDTTSDKITSEIAEGYRFEGSNPASTVTNALKKTIELNEVDILVAKQKFTSFKQIERVVNKVANNGKTNLVLIADKIGEDVIKAIYEMAYRKQNPFNLFTIQAPGRGEEAYKDIATVTGGKYFSQKDDLESFELEDLGFVEKFDYEDGITYLVKGKGTDEARKNRVKEVEEEIRTAIHPAMKKDKEERLSALSKGYGVIKIGAATNDERNWLKYKIEDARGDVKWALREGIVRGGGLAFKKISEALPKDHVLKEALLYPYKKLVENAGGKFEVPKNIFDPVTTEKAVIKNACGAVSKLIRIGGAICYAPKPDLEEVIKGLINQE